MCALLWVQIEYLTHRTRLQCSAQSRASTDFLLTSTLPLLSYPHQNCAVLPRNSSIPLQALWPPSSPNGCPQTRCVQAMCPLRGYCLLSCVTDRGDGGRARRGTDYHNEGMNVEEWVTKGMTSKACTSSGGLRSRRRTGSKQSATPPPNAEAHIPTQTGAGALARLSRRKPNLPGDVPLLGYNGAGRGLAHVWITG